MSLCELRELAELTVTRQLTLPQTPWRDTIRRTTDSSLRVCGRPEFGHRRPGITTRLAPDIRGEFGTAVTADPESADWERLLKEMTP